MDKESNTEIQRAPSPSDGQVLDHVAMHQRNMAKVNHAIEKIGFGKYQWKLFATWPLTGALSCGILVDIIGRRLVWQTSLIMVTVFTLICAGSPNFPALCVFVALQAVGAVAIDMTVFVEALPKAKDYMITALPLWWGVGSTLGGVLAWPLITFYSCPQRTTPDTCDKSDNMGWRYQYLLVGGISLIAALIRVFLMRMEESPKWLVSQGKYEKAVYTLHEMAHINGHDLSLSVDEFYIVGSGETLETSSLAGRLRGLFATKKQGYSTAGVILLWMCIGVAYPVYSLYLPIYLENNGAKIGNGSTFQTYRDYTISSTVGIFGPLLSTYMVNIEILGRRRSMSLTALCAAAFSGGFTAVRNEASNLGFSCMISFWQNAFYAILYPYTPEVMPTAFRGTGCGVALAFGRIASLSSPFIAAFGDLTTTTPIWVLVGLYGVIAAVAACLPFEPKHFSEEDRH
ncbi:sugar transporter [Fusarium albosuccineum]|uniref:Sugar transporter n=1 Tax=Fusarium albosuccineum TaxID=1237068 RepID=A0A8H4LBE6_9HYPO|nr:sugar transporter [Fusarium albosuccineum]